MAKEFNRRGSSLVTHNSAPTGRTTGASGGFDMVNGIPVPEDRSVKRFDGAEFGDSFGNSPFATSVGGYTSGIGGRVANDISGTTDLGDAYNAVNSMYGGDASTSSVNQAVAGSLPATSDYTLGMLQSQQNAGAATSGGATGGLGSLNPGGLTLTGPLGSLITQGQDALNAVASKVGDAIDDVFRILRLPNPSKIIGAPNTKTGTIVWGQTGGSPVINTGTTGAGTKTGITTGNVVLDAILNKMTGVLIGKISADQAISLPTLQEILIATAAEETGLSTDKVGEIITTAQTVADAALNVTEVVDTVADGTAVGVDLTGGRTPEEITITDDAAALAANTGPDVIDSNRKYGVAALDTAPSVTGGSAAADERYSGVGGSAAADEQYSGVGGSAAADERYSGVGGSAAADEQYSGVGGSAADNKFSITGGSEAGDTKYSGVGGSAADNKFSITGGSEAADTKYSGVGGSAADNKFSITGGSEAGDTKYSGVGGSEAAGAKYSASGAIADDSSYSTSVRGSVGAKSGDGISSEIDEVLNSSDIRASSDGVISDEELTAILKDIGGRPAVKGGYDTPGASVKGSSSIKGSSSTTGSSGGGGGGMSAPTGGSPGQVAGEPGDLVDIRYLFDMADPDIFPPYLTEEEEDELLYPYKKGGAVKRFHTGGGVAHNHNTTGGQDDSYNLAPGADDGGGGGFNFKSFMSDNAAALIGGGIGALFGTSGGSDGQNPSGYQGGIPEYTYDRTLKDNAFAPTMLNAAGETVARRSGSGGRSYFNYPTTGVFSPVTTTDASTGVTTQNTLGGYDYAASAAAAEKAAADQEAYNKLVGQGYIDAYKENAGIITGTSAGGNEVITGTGGATTANELVSGTSTAADELISGTSTAANEVITGTGGATTANEVITGTGGATTANELVSGTSAAANELVSGTSTAANELITGTGGATTANELVSGTSTGGAYAGNSSGSLASISPGSTTATTTGTASSAIYNYLSGMGFGDTARDITAADVAAFGQQNTFSLDDIATALGTDAGTLNSISNYVAPTALQTALSGMNYDVAGGKTITAGDIATLTTAGYALGDIATALNVTEAQLNSISNYVAPTALQTALSDMGFAAEGGKTITAQDISTLTGNNFALGDIATALNVTEAQLNSISNYVAPTALQTALSDMGFAAEGGKTITAQDISTLTGNNFALGDIATALGVTEAQLNSISNYVAPTALQTALSDMGFAAEGGKTITAQDISTLTGNNFALGDIATALNVTEAQLNSISNYVAPTALQTALSDMGFAAEGGKTITAQDISTLTGVNNNFALGDIATALGVTEAQLNSISNYVAPTALQTALSDMGFAAEGGKTITAQDISTLTTAGYALGDIATALGVTEAQLNSISSYTPLTALQTALSALGFAVEGGKTITAGEITALTGAGYAPEDIATALNVTTDQLNSISNYTPPTALQTALSGMNYDVAGGKTITAGDIATLTTAGYALGDIATALNVTEAQLNSISNYVAPTALQTALSDMGFAAEGGKTITAQDISTLTGVNNNFALGDIATALGVTEAQLNSISNYVAPTALQTALSDMGFAAEGGKTITAQDISTLTGVNNNFALGDIATALGVTEAQLNSISNYVAPTALQTALSGMNYDVAGGKTITAGDIATLTTAGYALGDIATALGVTEAQLNSISSYTGPTEKTIAINNYLVEAGFGGEGKEITKADVQGWIADIATQNVYSLQDIADAFNMPLADLQAIGNAAAAGGLMESSQGYYLGGTTDGMADQVPATIDGGEPARLSDGEFVVPADVVSHLGNGNSQAGSQQLYSMMDRVRKERTGTTKQGVEINPMQQLPA